VFVRTRDAGLPVEMHFCPECGTSVYWQAAFLAGHVGIAAGAFCDPAFPQPTVSAWERTRHPWVAVDGDVLHLPEQ